MATLEAAVDALMKEEEHLLLTGAGTYDLRSTRDEQMITAIHARDGKVLFTLIIRTEKTKKRRTQTEKEGRKCIAIEQKQTPRSVFLFC